MIGWRKTITALLAGSIGLAAVAASAQPLIVSTNVPATHWSSVRGGEPWMACVRQATDNAVEFQYFPTGQIANVNNALDALNQGVAQIAYIAVVAYSNKLPLNGISMLPDMGETVVEMTRANRKALDAGGPLLQEFTNNKIRPLLINMYPVYQLLSRKEPLDTVEKMKGRKISSGGGVLLLTSNALGVTGVEIAAADVYMALQQGTVDGSILAYASITSYKLQEVIKAVSGNGSFGSAAGIWAIDQGTWDKLPPAHQKAMTDCGLKVEAEMAAWVDASTEALKSEMRASGINVYDFSGPAKIAINEKMKVTRENYLARLNARGLPAQQAYQDYLKALGR